MALQFVADLNLQGGTYRDAVASSGNLYVGTSSPTNLLVYDLVSLNLSLTSQTLTNAPASVCLISTASAACANSTNGTLDLVELSGGYKQNYANAGSGANPNAQKGQQLAAQAASGIAIWGSATTGEVNKFSTTTYTCSRLTVSAISGQKALTVVAHPTDGNFLIGTNNGKVIEIDTAGNAVKTITLPTTPNDGTTPTLQVTGISLYLDNLLVVTSHGIVYHYTYSTSTLLEKQLITGSTSATSGAALCDSACGVVVFGCGSSVANACTPTYQIDFSKNALMIVDCFMSEFSVAGVSSGIDFTSGRAFMGLNSIVFGLRVFSITQIGKTQEITRSQDPANTDVAARVIRILDGGVGRSRVEIDQNVSAGAVLLECIKNGNYIEISIESGKSDVRLFGS